VRPPDYERGPVKLWCGDSLELLPELPDAEDVGASGRGPMTRDESALATARRRYKAARSRALYWSGNPSFTGRRFRVNGPHRHDHDLMYECAMNDCESWEAEIERLTGTRPQHYDPERLCREWWSRLMSKRRSAHETP